jgi:hypothetical protein
MIKLNKIQQDENGFASIVIALIMIIVLGLMSVGFAQLARQEQQSALTKQLSNQAFDAAESGINDAYSDIQDGKINVADSSLNKCMNNPLTTSVPPSALIRSNTIDKQYDVGYTCVLADLSPTNLHFSDLDPGQSYTIPIATEGHSLGGLRIGWVGINGHGYKTSNPGVVSEPASTSVGFLPSNIWNDSAHNYDGVLETSITPLGTGINLNSKNLANMTYTTLGYPVDGTIASPPSNTPAYTPQSPGTSGNEAPITPAYCDGSNCGFSIAGLPTYPTIANTKYYYLLRITDLYNASDVVISGNYSGSQSDTLANFYDSQAQLDVTGKAHNVEKRIQVDVPLTQEPDLPAAALLGKNICKQFNTDPRTGETGPPFDAVSCS